MALNKIIYFIVEKALIERGELLTAAKIEAWEHGPVFREIYHSFKCHGDGPITSRAHKFDSATRSMVEAKELFGHDDEELFDEALDSYLHLTASQLRALSHQSGSPWHRVWWHEGRFNPGMEISIETIHESFSQEAKQS
ncbi:Panacea domain-containing protein [Sphingosinicella humi]|uniref:Antitoxin SocA-like Panacea domain-containing protein n=1 Tax=Allosphingosinicella humi TaxID=2068657 RepID=A0A2U2J2T2_9SPHN|nr:type II toxin-antitoxin system antitoxin SocA domain-containing protein [Sphingosinicella humi]PWG02622.1 hypothetical protein DF286_06900 [Sphingosinicella humi]